MSAPPLEVALDKNEGPLVVVACDKAHIAKQCISAPKINSGPLSTSLTTEVLTSKIKRGKKGELMIKNQIKFILLLSIFFIQSSLPSFSMEDNDEKRNRPPAKVEKSLNDDKVTNILRFIVAIEQENEGLHDLANHNYQVAFEGETNTDFHSISSVSKTQLAIPSNKAIIDTNKGENTVKYSKIISAALIASSQLILTTNVVAMKRGHDDDVTSSSPKIQRTNSALDISDWEWSNDEGGGVSHRILWLDKSAGRFATDNKRYNHVIEHVMTATNAEKWDHRDQDGHCGKSYQFYRVYIEDDNKNPKEKVYIGGEKINTEGTDHILCHDIPEERVKSIYKNENGEFFQKTETTKRYKRPDGSLYYRPVHEESKVPLVAQHLKYNHDEGANKSYQVIKLFLNRGTSNSNENMSEVIGEYEIKDLAYNHQTMSSIQEIKDRKENMRIQTIYFTSLGKYGSSPEGTKEVVKTVFTTEPITQKNWWEKFPFFNNK